MPFIKYFKAIIFLAAIFVTFSSTAHETKKDSETELYASIDQLILSNEGIFIDLEDRGFIPVKSVTYLQDGLYLILTYVDPACGHTVYCPRCGGCFPKNRCQYRCKCEPRR